MSTSNTALEEAVRARAYELWESEGRPIGRDTEHWLRAIEELQTTTQVQPAAKAVKPGKRAANAPAKPRAAKSSKATKTAKNS